MLALRAARAVVKLVEQRYRVVDAIVEQRDAKGKRMGEHDLLCEEREPAAASALGLASWESKFRHIETGKLLKDERRQLQEEAWKLWPAAKLDTEYKYVERVVLLLRWYGEKDLFNLGDWKEVYAEAVSSTVEENKPERWEPLFGWKRSLPSAAQLQEDARAKAAAQAVVKAEAAALTASRRAFKVFYNQCRKCVKHGKEMRSISDLLCKMGTAKAKKVKPTIGEKLRPGKTKKSWPQKWQWKPKTWGTDASCGSKCGGGSGGHVATEDALFDIYCFVKDP